MFPSVVIYLDYPKTPHTLPPPYREREACAELSDYF